MFVAGPGVPAVLLLDLSDMNSEGEWIFIQFDLIQCLCVAVPKRQTSWCGKIRLANETSGSAVTELSRLHLFTCCPVRRSNFQLRWDWWWRSVLLLKSVLWQSEVRQILLLGSVTSLGFCAWHLICNKCSNSSSCLPYIFAAVRQHRLVLVETLAWVNLDVAPIFL